MKYSYLDYQLIKLHLYILLGIVLFIIFVSILFISHSEDVKVAFIGDQGLGKNAEAVLQLIKDEKADMVIHSGDFDYEDDPDAWEAMLDKVLGSTFPYFASVGNHEEIKLNEYQHKLLKRYENIEGAKCVGELGIMSVCKYRGLFMIFTAPGIITHRHRNYDYSRYIKLALDKVSPIWSICSFHKNQALMQTGGKDDETGWGVYEECRKGGAIIATGHEHAYSRTYLMDNFQTQSIASKSSTLKIDKGKTFAFVSGIAGYSIRHQVRDDNWWASIYTKNQGADYGALFCSFKKRKADCYFKDISGNIPDEFTVINKI